MKSFAMQADARPSGRTLIVLAFVIGVSACGPTSRGVDSPTTIRPELSSQDSTSTTSVPAGQPLEPTAVGVRVTTFIDESRPTMASNEYLGAPTRTFPTRIYYPAVGAPADLPIEDAEPEMKAGPYPLIVFSHGYFGIAYVYEHLLIRWAERGYVIVAPDYPLTSALALEHATTGDYVIQPADTSFVLDQALAMNVDPESWFHGLADPDRLAAAGHSLGSATTVALVSNKCCIDERFDIAIVMASGVLDYPGEEMDADTDIPMLIMHGDADDTMPFDGGYEVFERAKGHRFFIRFLGAPHEKPFLALGDAAGDIPPAVGVDFLDYYFRGVPDALDRLRIDAVVEGLTELEEAGG